MLFYTGPRPITRGRSRADIVHPYRSGTGTYSNFDLYHTSQVFDGAPNDAVNPGEGLFPHGLQMSRWYQGLRDIWPLDDSGGGTRIEGMRYRPLEYKGTDGQGVFSDSGYGHVDRLTSTSLYDYYTFDGVDSGELLTDVGHVRRSSGGAATFGAFDPFIYKGVDSSTVFVSTFGEALPDGYDNDYGQNRVLEHRGVTSSQALTTS